MWLTGAEETPEVLLLEMMCCRKHTLLSLQLYMKHKLCFIKEQFSSLSDDDDDDLQQVSQHKHIKASVLICWDESMVLIRYIFDCRCSRKDFPITFFCCLLWIIFFNIKKRETERVYSEFICLQDSLYLIYHWMRTFESGPKAGD